MVERSCFFYRELLGVALLVSVVGCGSGSDSADFNVAGKVTFDGQPIPVGIIQFVPIGGGGSQGFARIEDGNYDTSSGARARGISAGEHLVKVVGYDGVAYEDDDNEINGNGSLLFAQYQIKKTFEAKDSQFDIQVPGSSKPK